MRILANRNGFTYVLALTVVVIMGIMLGMAGQTWKVMAQRELEEEMIFRGDQIAEVIYQKLLYKSASMTTDKVNMFLWTVESPNGTILDDLIIGRDETFSGKPPRKFRIRPSAAIDPMTGKQWQIIKPVGDTTRFAGVVSESTKEPFRKSFKTLYDSSLLDDKKQYKEWQFTWELKKSEPTKKP